VLRFVPRSKRNSCMQTTASATALTPNTSAFLPANWGRGELLPRRMGSRLSPALFQLADSSAWCFGCSSVICHVVFLTDRRTFVVSISCTCERYLFHRNGECLGDNYFGPPCCCCCCTDSSPSTLLAAMNLYRTLALAQLVPGMGRRKKKRERTHSPPCQLPSPRIHSAWTLVMRSRFSVSARLADS